MKYDCKFKMKPAYCIECQPNVDACEKDAKKNKWHDQFAKESARQDTCRRLSVVIDLLD